MFVQKNEMLSRERAWIVDGLDSFGRAPWLQCLSGAIIFFIDDCDIVKVSCMILLCLLVKMIWKALNCWGVYIKALNFL